jgi:hypothetical protein
MYYNLKNPKIDINKFDGTVWQQFFSDLQILASTEVHDF